MDFPVNLPKENGMSACIPCLPSYKSDIYTLTAFNIIHNSLKKHA